MKRVISLILSFSLILMMGCSKNEVDTLATNDVLPQFSGLNDKNLLRYAEDIIYQETVKGLSNDEYFVENVSTSYVSKEYLEEVSYNSQDNIYFGYTLEELNDIFNGTRYIFTLGDDGKTIVQELQEIENVSAETVLKNVAIGTGVILVCVTVSAVTSVGAPAVSMIFAASATTAKTFAVSSAVFGGISAGVVKGIQTGDFEEAVKAAGMGATEGFKWGAISGAIVGGGSEAFLLKTATKNGLTMNDAALIQAESNLPIDVISQLHSMDEYLIYKRVGLKPVMVNGKTALVQNIDLDYMSQLPDGTEVTNLARMQKGYAPLDPMTGKAYQLHHVGQNADGTLATLTEPQHQGNSAILHIVGKKKEITDKAWAKQRKEFWEYLGNVTFANGGI